MYVNARFQSIGTTSDFGTKFAQNYITKLLEKQTLKKGYSNVRSYQISVNLENFSFGDQVYLKNASG